jgi:hypothetical protein
MASTLASTGPPTLASTGPSSPASSGAVTSAGIGAACDPGSLQREERRERGRRAAASALVVLLLIVGARLGGALLAADQRARCAAEREDSGAGRRAALGALDDPRGASGFFYRVLAEPDGYRVRVVVKDGPFLGEAWERDATGALRHLSDVCVDRGEARWAALLDRAAATLRPRA